MFDRIFALISVSIQRVTEYISTVFNNTGAFAYFVAFFSIFCVVRFLIKPLLGGGLPSDKAKFDKKGKANNDV